MTLQLKRKFRLIPISLFAVTFGLAPVNAEEAQSKIESVTLFREHARVVRKVDVNASPLEQTLTLSTLPSSMVLGSIRWEPSESVDIRSVNVTDSLDAPTPEERQRQLELEDKIRVAEQDIAVIEQDLLTLERLVQFGSAKSDAMLVQGKLDPASVTELAEFTIKRRRELIQELQQSESDLLRLKAAAEAQDQDPDNEGIDGQNSTGFVATMTVKADQAGTFAISYLVSDVYWSHRYTVDALWKENDSAEIRLQLDASIQQHSGERWENVRLAFSTVSATARASSPMLAPLRVSANKFDVPGQETFGNFTPTSNLPEWENGLSRQRNLVKNTRAAQRQLQEMNEAVSRQRTLADDATAETPDVTYAVEGRHSVAHQTEEQWVTLSSIEVESPVYRVVTPLLSSFAYLETEITNASGESLIGGEAQVLMNGVAIGKATIPPTAAGGKMVVGLGTDRQVRTRRELLSRNESSKGGNQLDELHYRLIISNYHNSPIKIRLYDRVPISTGESEIAVQLHREDAAKISQDARYLRLARPIGILRWDLDIPASRFGSNAFDHEYRFTLEREKEHRVVAGNVEEQMQQDLNFKGSGGGGMGGGMGGGFM